MFPTINRTSILLLLLTMLWWAGSVNAAYLDLSVSEGSVRIHYPTQGAGSCDVLMLGVGTAMSASSYDKLSTQLVQRGYVVAILDHAPGNLVKTDAASYRDLARAVKANLLSWISSSPCNAVAHWIMGGHSAGGQAAHYAVAGDASLADAVFSIDPFDLNNAPTLQIPAMYWGFDVTTCFVDKNKAAKKGYQLSQNKRAFYRVDRKYGFSPCGFAPVYFHCSFCDGHCPACTNCRYTPDHFYVDVANSVDRFVQAAFYGTWSKSALSISSTTPLRLFVDSDQP